MTGRFGVVQKHIYQNRIIVLSPKESGSELCKYAYTKIDVLCVEQNKGFGSVQHAYTKTLVITMMSSVQVRSCANTHIPKLCSLSTMQTFWVRSCIKNAYTKTSLPAETSNKRGSELNSTHIPKHVQPLSNQLDWVRSSAKAHIPKRYKHFR